MATKKGQKAAAASKRRSAPAAKTPTNRNGFLVAGLGASAGGIGALKEFFGGLPEETGMAFVVVLHLSPTHKSNLDTIVQLYTSMPVVQVHGSTKVEPDHVYVIPPNRNLVMVDGTVRTTKPFKEKGTRVAIDLLFRTLSEAYGRNAVCVVLSGTGTDGTLGLKAIKGRNGFAMVQDPADAEYDGMPQSAIQTRLVDVVLPASEMGAKLTAVRNSTERFQLHEEEQKVPDISGADALREILTVIRVRTGHDFSSYKHPTLLRRIARHLQIHDLDDMTAYLELLREKPEEVQSLVHNLLINVTNFFRDKKAFEALEKSVVPRLLRGKKGGDQVRIWTAGCASGEEAYSMAILFAEAAHEMPDPPKIQVFASDVDDDAIEAARQGRFVEAIATDVSPERLKRFFVKEGAYYRVKKALREMVLFAPHNVLRDPPFSRVDLISCRNVLIYLNRETQDTVLQIFHFALAPDGVLFLGSSETAEGKPALFAPIDKRQRIYSKRATRGSMPRLAPAPIDSSKWRLKSPEGDAIDREHAASFGEMHYKLVEQYAPPSVVVDENFDVVHLSTSAGRYLQLGGGIPSHNITKLVVPDLLPDLRAALFAAHHDRKTAEFRDIKVGIDGRATSVNLIVRPIELPEYADAYLLIIFEESDRGRPTLDHAQKASRTVATDGAMEGLVRRLEQELRRAKERLRSTIEQNETSVEELKASNEELQAINEELRSTTEELETSKEELQSLNEELTTVNHELKDKIDEVSRAHADLQNLMQATDIATIFLDRHLRIKRYTDSVSNIFNIIPSDIGRPLTDLTHQLDQQDFRQDVKQVLKTLQRSEREVRSSKDRVYIARFAPYRSADDKIEGVVVSFIDITDRKVAEVELARKEAELDLIANATPLILIRCSSALKYRYINSAGAGLFGRPADEIVGRSISSILGRKAFSTLRPYIDRVLAGERVEFESEIQYPAAGTRIVQATYVPEADDEGEVIGWLASMVDVTDVRLVERAAREVEARFRVMADTSPALIWFDDNKGQCQFVNQSYRDFCGKTEQDLQGDQWHLVLHPDDSKDYLSAFARAQKKREPFHARVRIKRHDGEWRWIESFANALFDDMGKYLGHVGISPDVTDRVEAEERLRIADALILTSRNQMRLVTDALPALISYVGSDQRYIFANRTYADWFGIEPEEVIGLPTRDIFGAKAYKFVKPFIETALGGTQANFEGEIEYKHGPARFVHGSYMPDVDKNGIVTGYFGVTMDITEFKRSEEMLRITQEKIVLMTELAETNTALVNEAKALSASEAHRVMLLRRLITSQEMERSRIARDIHDQLGQRLTGIRLKLQSMSNSQVSDSDSLPRSFEELQAMTEGLDAEVGFLAWELRPAALDDLGLVDALGAFVNEWSRHYQTEAVLHTHNLGKERLDTEIETHLYRIAQEALNNICKHAKATKVSIVLEKRGDEMLLIIEDDGVGFDPARKRRPLKSGRGLGLIGMQERATLMGGEYDIESSPGQGTTIYIRVPVASQPDNNRRLKTSRKR